MLFPISWIQFLSNVLYWDYLRQFNKNLECAWLNLTSKIIFYYIVLYVVIFMCKWYFYYHRNIDGIIIKWDEQKCGEGFWFLFLIRWILSTKGLFIIYWYIFMTLCLPFTMHRGSRKQGSYISNLNFKDLNVFISFTHVLTNTLTFGNESNLDYRKKQTKNSL